MQAPPPDPSSDRLTKQEIVRAGYRVLLGREPESDAVVDAAAAGCVTAEDILRHFRDSAEFHDIHERRELFALVQRGLVSKGPAVEVQTTPEQLAALFERVCGQWSRLGDSEPYWSVLTSDRFKMSSIADHRAEFELSGRHAVEVFERAMKRCGLGADPGADCLELGCGVGRITRYLAPRFRHVTGVDVSAGNLRLCAEYMAACGLANVDTRLLSAPADLAALPDFDVLYSVIVLQHNPPPVIKHMLDALLGKIRPGGIAYVQVPTHTLDYAFSVERYLATAPDVLDMHLLPMPEVLASLAAAGFSVREVLMDTWTGLYGSHTFLAVKDR